MRPNQCPDTAHGRSSDHLPVEPSRRLSSVTAVLVGGVVPVSVKRLALGRPADRVLASLVLELGDRLVVTTVSRCTRRTGPLTGGTSRGGRSRGRVSRVSRP